MKAAQVIGFMRRKQQTRFGQTRERDADRSLRILAEIIGPLTQSLGANYEIVLHDYRIPDRSVIAVAGRVTERRVGSAMSEIGLSVLAEGNKAEDRLNYLAKAPNGRIVNSSTIVLRDKRAKSVRRALHQYGCDCDPPCSGNPRRAERQPC